MLLLQKLADTKAATKKSRRDPTNVLFTDDMTVNCSYWLRRVKGWCRVQ